MLVKTADIEALFREVKKVQETLNEYCLAPDKVPASIDDLKYAIEQEYGVQIKYTLVPLHSEVLRGLIEIYKDRTEIFVDAGLSKAWTRYVVIKEMSHHLINKDVHHTADPTAIIEYIVQDGGGLPDQTAPPDVATEDLTKIAAYEFLFPRSLRQPAIDRIAAEKDTTYTIAEWLEIPEHLVELILSDKYHKEFAEKIWAKIR